MLKEFEGEYNRLKNEKFKENITNQKLQKKLNDSNVKLLKLNAILEYLESLKDIEKGDE